MKFTENKAMLLPYSPEYPLLHIEMCGRTCYNSLDAMGQGTALPFVQSLIKRHHYAMLEHANFVFQVEFSLYRRLQHLNEVCKMEDESEYPSWGAKHLSFTRVKVNNQYERCLVSGNVRSINNTRCYELTEALRKMHPELVYTEADKPVHIRQCVPVLDLFALDDLHEEEIRAHCYLTFCNDTDRGVTHEMVRHREASYAQESTRYCNYSKEKYGGEITFVKPSTFDQWPEQAQRHFRTVMQTLEVEYNMMTTDCKLSAQQARAFLPQSTKATIIMTSNVDEFIHFFALRYKGVTGAPHPDMKDLAGKMYEEYTRFFNMKGIRQFDNILL